MRLLDRVKRAKRVYICGNGGSGANADHIANDLLSRGIRAYALNSFAFLTATANDFGYEEVYARQVRIYCEPGDLLIALSGSGRSPNILAAMKAAEEIGTDAVLVTDYLKTLNMQQSEEEQIRLGHDLMRSL